MSRDPEDYNRVSVTFVLSRKMKQYPTKKDRKFSFLQKNKQQQQKNCTRIGVGIFHWLISLRFKLKFEVHKSESKKTKTNSSQFYLLTVVQALFNIWKKRHDVQRRILLSARSRADRTASSWSSLFWLNKAVGIPQNRKPILNPFLYFLHVRVVIFMLVE